MTNPNYTADQIISAYIRVRDMKAELKAKHSKELAPYDEALFKLECRAMELLNSQGSESVRTSAGTMYKSTRTSVTVADKSAFLDYVKENMAFDLLDIKANKTAVEDFISANQDIPPGTNVRREDVVGFRRS